MRRYGVYLKEMWLDKRCDRPAERAAWQSCPWPRRGWRRSLTQPTACRTENSAVPTGDHWNTCHQLRLAGILPFSLGQSVLNRNLYGFLKLQFVKLLEIDVTCYNLLKYFILKFQILFLTLVSVRPTTSTVEIKRSVCISFSALNKTIKKRNKSFYHYGKKSVLFFFVSIL